jgi:phage/plasmid primase-like uncharacterized protein
MSAASHNPDEAFRQAIAEAGLHPPATVIADGQLHRFASSGSRRARDGWYTLHLDGIPSGAFGCWRLGTWETWCALDTRQLTNAERAEQRHRMVAAAAQRREAEAADRARRLRIAERIVDGSGPLPDSPAWHYLEGRGIHPSSLDVLRFSAAVWHPYERREMPAMVGRIEHPLSRRFQGVHVTFLDADRKAAVKPTKIMRGIAREGIVRLAEPTETLALAEGIESALSFAQLARIPTWAALSAGNLINVMLPADVREVVIAADNDERGLADARKAGHRWRMEGRRVRIVRPTVAGQDWNDILAGGAHG